MSISARTRQSTWSTEAPEASGARNLAIWGADLGGRPFSTGRHSTAKFFVVGVLDGFRAPRKADACVRVVRLAEVVKERPIFEGASRLARKRLNMPILLLRCMNQPIFRASKHWAAPD